MSEMDHGTAHERIEDLLLEPARLAGLDASTAPEDLALRRHLAGCPACRADLDGWARLHSALADALPDDAALGANVVQRMEPPASLRARLIAAVRSEVAAEAPLAPVSMAAARPRFAQPRLGWLGLAAALVVLAVTAGMLVEQSNRRAAAEADARQLAMALSAVDRMLATEHKIVELRTQAGVDAGSITWSRHDWVVLTTALPAPERQQVYRCWLEADGRSVAVGQMEFAGETAYWVASTDEWQTWEIGPTTKFVVTLEAAAAQDRAGPSILEADLGS